MKRPRLARSCLTAFGAVVLASTSVARGDGDEQSPDPDRATVPAKCVEYWSIPEGSGEPAAWQAVLSFAACIQDTRTAEVDRADQLEPLLDQLQTAMQPAMTFYLAVIEDAPDPLKLRAAYAIGMAELSLITRARASIVVAGRDTDPEAAGRFLDLHAQLEPLLQPHAKLAYLLFVTIDEAARENPRVAPDPVTRYVVRSARVHAQEIRKGWTMPRVDDEPPQLTEAER